jgi:hypothetical protein
MRSIRSGTDPQFLNLQEVTPKLGESQSGGKPPCVRYPTASSAHRLGLTAAGRLIGEPVDEGQAAC